MNYLLGAFFCSVLMSSLAWAEPLVFDRIIDSVKEPLVERTQLGEVQAIDLVARSIDISGFRYYLPAISDPEPLQVFLAGGRSGALQLIKVGMHTEVVFIQVGDYRLGYKIIQVASSDRS